MGAIEELNNLLTISVDAELLVISEHIDEIAQLLLNHSCIRRGSKTFYIEEIEFYFYNRNHRDLITYPRNTKSLNWYLNAFGGIDITFDSHVTSHIEDDKEFFCLDNNSVFGGILLRKFSCDNEIVNYPMNCAYKMFNILNASSLPNDYPLLIESDDRKKIIKKKPRTNILTSRDTIESKVKKILKNNCITNELTNQMLDDFSEFINKEYKYYTD